MYFSCYEMNNELFPLHATHAIEHINFTITIIVNNTYNLYNSIIIYLKIVILILEC